MDGGTGLKEERGGREEKKSEEKGKEGMGGGEGQ